MICQQCGQKMRLLFTSFSCDLCDSGQNIDELGFVVLEGPLKNDIKRPVFRTYTMARLWATIRGLLDAKICPVKVPSSIKWKEAHGRLAGIELATTSFRVEAAKPIEETPSVLYLAT